MKVSWNRLLILVGVSGSWQVMYTASQIVTCTEAQKARADKLVRYVREPLVNALFDTIAYAEGTLINGARTKDSYRIAFGGGLFTSFEDHPRKKTCIIRNGKEICTTGSGCYQIQRDTWDHFTRIRCVTKGCSDDTSFSPFNQDLVAMQAIIDCGALSLLFQKPIPFKDLFARLGKTWASMPGTRLVKSSVYTDKQLQRIFERQLKKYV